MACCHVGQLREILGVVVLVTRVYDHKGESRVKFMSDNKTHDMSMLRFMLESDPIQ